MRWVVIGQGAGVGRKEGREGGREGKRGNSEWRGRGGGRKALTKPYNTCASISTSFSTASG